MKSLQSCAFEFLELSKRAKDNLTPNERKALERLSSDNSIIITKADKGNAVVIQNTRDYRAKIAELLAEDGKFKRLDGDDTKKRECSLQHKLRRLHAQGKFPENIYRKILPCGSKAGVLYGLPKIHKEGSPIRPIISAIGTYTYNLAKHLDEIIKPILSKSSFMIKDTFDFVNTVSQTTINQENCIVSFDVSSLFTNVPVSETIELILNRLFKKKSDTFQGLSRRNLKELLEICVQKSIFVFNGEYYEQIDGVSMGSPLGPLFANIFMDELENKNFVKLKNLGVEFWKRYVDDTFVILKSASDAKPVLDLLNTLHKNIKFTTEKEKDGKIPFLDILVKRRKDRLYTELYRKPTFTGVYLHWDSLTSRKYKIGLIKCLLNRIWSICSDPETRSLEASRTKSILLRNNYPAHVLDKEIANFVAYREKLDLRRTSDDRNSYEKGETDVQKQVCYMKLPYYGPECENFGVKLRRLVETNYKSVSLKVAFTAPSDLGKHFSFKDKITEVEKQSLVVYHIKCKECSDDYIGKTERILAYRIKEHQSSKKDKKGNYESSVYAHHAESKHVIDWDGIKIVDRADSDAKLKVKEILHIDKKKPSLNVQVNSQTEFRLNVNIVGSRKKKQNTN